MQPSSTTTPPSSMGELTLIDLEVDQEEEEAIHESPPDNDLLARLEPGGMGVRLSSKDSLVF